MEKVTEQGALTGTVLTQHGEIVPTMDGQREVGERLGSIRVNMGDAIKRENGHPGSSQALDWR